MDNNSLSHCKWECQYHIVFIPKYRKKVLYGKVKDDIREIIRTLCKYKKVEIIAGAVCSDHVHLCVSIPPKLSVSEFVGYLKEICTDDIRQASRNGEQVGQKFLGKRILCCYSRQYHRRKCEGIYPQASRRIQEGRTTSTTAALSGGQ